MIQAEKSNKKKEVITAMDGMAAERGKWIERNRYYYQDLFKFFKYNVPANAKILEIGCGTGELIKELDPARGVGVDISPAMIKIAQEKYKEYEFIAMDAEALNITEKFDYVIISDTLGYFEDIQKVFAEIKKVSIEETRVIITFHNFLWTPFLKLAEFLKFKMPQKRLNWLNQYDIANLLNIEGYEIIKSGKRFLFPVRIPILSDFINRYLAPLPLLNTLCLAGYLVARPLASSKKDYNVSIIIPARNEKGNIANALKRLPKFGHNLEVIYVEGHSNDGTLEEIKNICENNEYDFTVRYAIQDGRGKGDAVRKGFDMAQGEMLMILDADLTVPPEDLPKFYEAISSGKGELIDGTRLVYPLEKEAMRTLNIFGNKFFSLMFTWLLGQRIKDTLCGTKVMLKSNYEKIKTNRQYFGDFDPFGDFDLIFGAAKLNLKILEIPIRYQARAYGETNISRFRHGWLLIKMVFFAMNKIKFI
jgi:ubiquinone/menaquinone biosynthesis C-methylase UbiE